MSFTHTYTRSYVDSSANVLGATPESITDDTELNFDGSIPGPSTNAEVDWTCTVANLKCVMLLSTINMTVKTNSTGTPQETITLVANRPLIYSLASDGVGKIPFAGNVTKLYCTIGGSTAASFKVRGVAHQAIP